MVAKVQKVGAGHGYAVLPKAIAAALFCIFAVSPAVAGTDCWTYHPPTSGTRGTISWTDSSGFENVIKGIILSDGQIRIYPNYNKNSTTLKNADFSIPVRDEDGGELAYSPDFLAGKDDTGQAILGYINGLTNIIVNANATRIGNYAFKTNPNLIRVRLNDGLKSIGTEGFNECEALETVENFFPDSLEALGSKAFYGCKVLASDMTANGLQSIKDRVFRSCQSLRAIDLGNAPVTNFPEYVFFDCPKLGSAILPKTLRTMGIGVFEGCSSLTNVTPLLPPKLETLGTDSNPVFINDPIQGHVVSPPMLARIGTRAFRASKIETFTAAKEGLKSIGQYAFYQNYNLTNIVLSADLESLTGGWVDSFGTAGVEQHIWFRNLPATLPSGLWSNTKKQNIMIHLPWSQQEAWREWVASGPSGHTFTFGGETKTLPRHFNDVGTWSSSVLQNVTWWKDSGQRFTITVR